MADRRTRRTARRHEGLRLLALAALAGLALAAAAADVPVPKPAIPAEAGTKCVEDTATIRRTHMELLRHQRDRTVHEGVRTKQHSLANCIECHASRETGRVTGSRDAFCEGCHAYVGVKLDCFECHSDRAAAIASAGAAK
jgi:hypothetical protein